jgi:hypothetical protein
MPWRSPANPSAPDANLDATPAPVKAHVAVPITIFHQKGEIDAHVGHALMSSHSEDGAL